MKAKNKWERSHNPMSKQHNRNPKTKSPKCACRERGERERERERAGNKNCFKSATKHPKLPNPGFALLLVGGWVGRRGKSHFHYTCIKASSSSVAALQH
jgi:hypothetical protein